MITFFPSPYKDEILYSILTRYHIRSGNTSYFTTNEDLYGNGNIVSSIDLPSNNNALISNMPAAFNYRVEEVIKKYTLFNYYTSFISKQRKDDVLQMLKGNDGRGVHSIVGAGQKGANKEGYFKICPICYKEEVEDYGEAYLHRINQIPEVLICSKHEVPLMRSKNPIYYYGKNSYVRLKEDEFVEFKEIKHLLMDNIDIFLKLNKSIQYLLDENIDSKDDLWITEQYKNRLKQMELCTPSGRVDIEELQKRFIDYYGEEFLMLFDFNFYSANSTNWIKYMVRSSRSKVNPIKHLLLIDFMNINIEEFFTKKITYEPFGRGPWVCLNKICCNYSKPTIKTIEIGYNSKKRKPVGKFKCEQCGFTYSRCGPDICEEDKYKIGKIITIGDLYKEEIRRLWNKNYSIRQIARELKLGQRTVKKYITTNRFDMISNQYYGGMD